MPLPAAAIAELNAESCATAYIHLVTIDHEDLDDPLLLSDDLADVESRSDTYSAFPMEVALATDAPGEAPRGRLVLCAVDRTIVQALRTITSPFSVLIEVVRSADPDTVLRSFQFEACTAAYDAKTVQIELGMEPVLEEPFPRLLFTPNDFAALFAR